MRFRLELGIRHALVIAVACALATSAAAQTWPARPVRIVVPFPPGGGLDFVVRLLAQKLTEQIGGSFVVDNRPGAAGVVGTELVARAAPDGYTLLTSSPEFSLNPSTRSKLPYDPLKHFAFISQLTSASYMLASHPSVPVKTVKQLIVLAKARPGHLNYGHAGMGSIHHLAGELFQTMAGIRWVHVPFKGTVAAVIGLMGGEVDFVFASNTGLMEPAKAGKVRPIAVTGTKRFTELPDVPTIAESGIPGYNVTGWQGFYAPAGTSADIVRRLHAEAGRALNSPDVKEKLVKTGNEPDVSSPEEFAAFVRAEIGKWTKVVKESNLRID
ncbi:MAG: tripartite tricarboxylate transporter substrate binding protein [Betaproteobacteria bacterium]|nr:tripartite tricarboxylate transporter substrate binding protein [Betaproteobacteria bacterium]